MITNDAPSSPASRWPVWTAAFLLAAVTGFYLVRGMPWVHVDDYSFVGVGIDLARTGQLTNRSMAGWLSGFGTDKFYIQLPFQSYSLAGWILLFGSYPGSLLVFCWVFYAVGGYGLVRVLGRFGLPLSAGLLLAIVYLTVLIQTGLRPETEAFGWLFLGLSLVDTRAAVGRKLAAMLLLGFSVLTYPLTLGLGGPFTLALLWLQRPPGTRTGDFLRGTVRAWWLPMGLAVVVVGLSFLAMVHFEPGRFWAVFEAHRRSRALPEGAVRGYFHLITQYHEASLTLPLTLLLIVAALVVAAQWRRTEPGLRVLAVACVAGSVACVELYAVRAPGWVGLLAFCAAGAAVCGPEARRYRPAAVGALGLLYLWSQSMWIVNAALRQFPDATALRAARAAVPTDKTLVIDSSTARYVFDYQLPEGARIGGYITPWRPEASLSPAVKTADACWVVSETSVDDVGGSGPGKAYPRIRIGHHEFSSLLRCPDEPVVMP